MEGQGQEVAGDGDEEKREGQDCGRKDGEGDDRGRKDGEGEDSGRKEGAGEEDSDDPLTATLSRTVNAVGGELCEIGTEEKQRVEMEPEDQHPDKGLISGSSGDGLSQDMATEEIIEEGRSQEGEEARTPKTLPAPSFCFPR